MRSSIRVSIITAALLSAGCDLGGAEDDIDDVTRTEVRGSVTDNRGQPVAGATVKLFDLGENTNFVEGGDIASLEAYIDRAAVIASTNALTTVQTDADGTFLVEDVPPSAFLASVTTATCSAGFAGFDEETGVLNANTLLTPDFDDGLTFEIPPFTLACATPPEVGPDGNSDAAPPFEPPIADPSCDADACTAAGGRCDGDACSITCSAASCEASGGSCVEGACALAACNADACADAGGSCVDDRCELTACDTATCEGARGTCSADGTSCDIPPCFAAEADCTAAGGACSSDGAACELPACSSDADCDAGQPGATCRDPGDVALATCVPPEPGEIVTPTEPLGWTAFRITDAAGNVLADASTGDTAIAAEDIPPDGVVRIQADYDGEAATTYVHVQTGSQSCAELPPSTDAIAAALVDGATASSEGDFVELVLHRGFQKIQLGTSAVLGEGDRSHVVTIGDECAPPASSFIAILDWDAGPGMPADLDLTVWNAAGELVFIGNKQAAWGKLALEGQGPGPEVFEAVDAGQGPFTIKVQFFSGKPRAIVGQLRIIRTGSNASSDETFEFTVARPKDVAEVGVFTAEP